MWKRIVGNGYRPFGVRPRGGEGLCRPQQTPTHGQDQPKTMSPWLKRGTVAHDGAVVGDEVLRARTAKL